MKSALIGFVILILIYVPLSIFFPLVQFGCLGVGQGGAFCGEVWATMFGGLGVSPLAFIVAIIITVLIELGSKARTGRN